jgi:hypothetical protein
MQNGRYYRALVPELNSSKSKKAILLLEDWTFSIGYLFEAAVKVPSEGAFSTSMVNERRGW